MTHEMLSEGNELRTLMTETIAIISELESFIENVKMKKQGQNHQDGYYSMNISHYSDEQGDHDVCFDRSMGNLEILNIVLETLNVQYRRYERMFAELGVS